MKAPDCKFGTHAVNVAGSSPALSIMAPGSAGRRRHPVTVEMAGSNPVGGVKKEKEKKR